MANRHRTDKLTTKHSIIGDYKKILLDISAFDEVDSIITGQISNNKTHQIGLSFQYFTETGIKLLAKTTNSVQEIFIVTKHKQTLLDLLQGYGLLESDLTSKDEVSVPESKQKAKTKSQRISGDANQSKQHTSMNGTGTRITASGKEVATYTQKESPLSLGDHLQSDTMAKLLSAKEQLEKERTSAQPERGSKPRPKQTNKKFTSHSDEDEMTMEELFNPKDDGESFADLFNNSKLDWRKFK